MTKEEMRKKVVEHVHDFGVANITLYDAADRILALMPDPALAEIGRLAVECKKLDAAWEKSTDVGCGFPSPDIVAVCRAAESKLEVACATYLTSDHPPRRESTEKPT